MTLPSLLLSHGAPTLPLTDTPARTFLSQIGDTLERPKAILVISAHWKTAVPTVNAVESNETIHDFGWISTGALRSALPCLWLTNICGARQRRGLDHGAWVPLLLMYPRADIPVLQLSVQPHLGPEHHLRIGRALAPLRDEGVLIIGSGSFTHNLYEFSAHAVNDPALPYVNAFADWFDAALRENRLDDLLSYREHAPCAVKNHPTEEHLLPLYAAAGAAGANPHVKRLHASATYGVIRMDVYAFEEALAAAAWFSPAYATGKAMPRTLQPPKRKENKMFTRVIIHSLSAIAVAASLSVPAHSQTAWEKPATPPPANEKQAAFVERHLKVFDDLDFDVFSNQKWDRLKESHAEDIVVTWPDGHETTGLMRHTEDLKVLFVFAPDIKIKEHPIRFGSGTWTVVTGVTTGTFTKPMPVPGGKRIAPTGKRFAIRMVTVGHWRGTTMDHEWLFWDNQDFMKQIGLQ